MTTHHSASASLALAPRITVAIGKTGRSHARVILVEAAWAAAKVPGPLRGFF